MLGAGEQRCRALLPHPAVGTAAARCAAEQRRAGGWWQQWLSCRADPVPSLGQAGGAELGWTLGYMLNLTNAVPAEVPARLKGHRAPLWAAAITFIILTLVLGLAALLLQLWV